MKQLDNGMKPSEYLSTHEGRVKLNFYVYGMMLTALNYPPITSRLYLLSNGEIEEKINLPYQDWDNPENTICILCEMKHDGDLVVEYINANCETAKDVEKYLLEHSDEDEEELWYASKKQKAFDRWGVYYWFKRNTKAVGDAFGDIRDEMTDDYEEKASQINKKLKAEAN